MKKLIKLLNTFLGIFHNNDQNLFVWVNEEDQMRIVSMEKGEKYFQLKIYSSATAATFLLQISVKLVFYVR